jgi:hypothetical protein
VSLNEIKRLLEQASSEERLEVLKFLRDRFQLALHPLESRWNTTAEVILEAIDRSGDLTQRGIRGILAEAIFLARVVPEQLPRWRIVAFEGDQPYDVLLDDGNGPVRVQVKLQRKEKGIPKLHRGSPDHFVVETQRTRGGTRPNQEQSRPYRRDEFDVLAVNLHPSGGDWTSFIYCAVHDLKVRASEPTLLEVMQPIPMKESEVWSRDFDHAVRRFRGPKS